MKRKLMITIDVEAQKFRAPNDHVNRLIWGRADGQELGIGTMMSIADKYGVQLTFFHDYAERDLFGDDILDVAREIRRRGHDLQLHLHEMFFSKNFLEKHGISAQFNLMRSPKDHCRHYVDYLMESHAKVSPEKPIAHRNGGFWLGLPFLEVMSENGIKFDSSYLVGMPDKSPMTLGEQAFFWWNTENKICEIPVTCSPFLGQDHFIYNFNSKILYGQSVALNRELLDAFYGRYGNEAIAVMLLHSRSFYSLDAAGHYIIPQPRWAQLFESFIADCVNNMDIISMKQLAHLLDSEPSDPTVEAINKAEVIDITPCCPICGTLASQFKAYNATFPRECPKCRSLERQRVFFQFCQRGIFPPALFNKRRMLHVAASSTEKYFFKNHFNLGEIVTVDIRPEAGTDIVADISNMPEVPSESYDIVFLSYVLANVEYLDNAIKELARVLKPGGQIFCYDMLSVGMNTIFLTDHKKVTEWYGQDTYEKYHIGSFRTFGQNDYTTFFVPYFDCKLHEAIDTPTLTRQFWLHGTKKAALKACWRKHVLPHLSWLSPPRMNAANITPSTVPPLIPYEKIRAPKGGGTAEDILAHGWTHQNYGLFKFDEYPQWRMETWQSTGFTQECHGFSVLEELLRAYSDTGELRYLKPAVAVASSWVAHHAKQDAVTSSQAWGDLITGMRAYRLAFILEAASREKLLTAEELDLFKQMLDRHRVFLIDNKNFSAETNHGFFLVIGQLAMSRRFMDSQPLMKEAFEQGQQRLAAILGTHFTAEGVHKEHSPMYHYMLLNSIKNLLLEGLVHGEETERLCQKVGEAFLWFTFPDRSIVPFGDSGCSKMATKRPPSTMRLFSRGGYFVSRKPSPKTPDQLENDSYLAQLACFHSRVHKHADDLSFVWYDRGAKIFVDAGKLNYEHKTPERAYCASTRAHNTLEFDGLDYDRLSTQTNVRAKAYGSALKSFAETSHGVIAVESQVTHWDSIRHGRILIYLPTQWLIVCDWFDATDAFHSVKQWFHLDAELSPAAGETGLGLKVPIASSPKPLQIAPLLDDMRLSRLYKGEHDEDGHLQGWYSPQDNVLSPNYAFNCHWPEKRSGGAMATLCSFSEDLQLGESEISSFGDGLKASFFWTDESGAHALNLERAPNGPLKIEYAAPEMAGLKIDAKSPDKGDSGMWRNSEEAVKARAAGQEKYRDWLDVLSTRPQEKEIFEQTLKFLQSNERFMTLVREVNTEEGDDTSVDMYRTLNYKIGLARLAFTAHMLNIPNTTSLVFDIGCGCGYFSHICQEYGHKVYSLDVEGTRAGHLFGRCQDIFALDMYLHTIKPFQPLPILPEKVDLTVGLTAHFHELPGGKFWGADAWRFFFKDLSKNMKLNGKLYLEAVIFEPLRKFQPEDFKETEDLFSSLGATINTYRIMFDSVEKFGQLPDVAQ